MQSRALVKERAQRNLLLVIDGIKTEEMLLAQLVGIAPADFQTLHTLGLIEPAGPPHARGASALQPPLPRPATTAPAPPVEVAAPLDYATFTAMLTQIISKELGLRGFVLTLAVEKAGTIEELQAVAQRTINQIRDRKGDAAAATARRALYGS